MYYILDKTGEVKEEPDGLKWAKWFEKSGKKRIVLRTKTKRHEVSTVFLSLDHNFRDVDKPILWETMVFKNGDGMALDGMEFTDRYTSKNSAIRGHNKILKKVLAYERLFSQ